jgi:hypothetical protein
LVLLWWLSWQSSLCSFVVVVVVVFDGTFAQWMMCDVDGSWGKAFVKKRALEACVVCARRGAHWERRKIES